jgi:hypothetical protein
MPEDQDNEQGGAPLSEPPPRPKSVLNPTTEAYRPKTTLKDLVSLLLSPTPEVRH